MKIIEGSQAELGISTQIYSKRLKCASSPTVSVTSNSQAAQPAIPKPPCSHTSTSMSRRTPFCLEMLITNSNLVNNSRFIGDRMRLSHLDTLCCPPPLFHCFGLVLGLLAAVTHGSKIVYPSEVFDAQASLRAVLDERCTALHGVPAMFDSLLALPEAANLQASKLRLRTGIIAGAPVPRYLMEQLVAKLGMRGLHPVTA